jgi:hypothetical protein
VTAEAATPDRLDSALARLQRAREVASAVRPAYVLATLVIAQWLALLALALTVRHNGWLYYAGGDQLWHYTGAYLLSHGHLPPSYVGYGWSVLLLPIAPLTGPNLVSALPAIVLLNTLVLLPVALLCVYGIAARIAGRLFGYWAAVMWIVVPYLGVVFVEPGYHQKYTELTLPQLLGLTSVPDFPATVALLVCAYFCLRALESSTWQAAAAAGLAAGYSIAVKPSNALFLVAPGLLFIASRWRSLLPFAAGLAPAVLTLALWKYRGLGELAAAPAQPVRLAGGVGDLLHRIHRPSLNSWEHLHQVLLGLREHFWAARVIEWLPLAGLAALLVRSRRGFLLVGSWFVAYLLAKGTYIPASVEDASFFRILMPAFPAYLVLAAAVVLLTPGVRARPEPLAPRRTSPRLTVAVLCAAVVFGALPLAVIAAVPQLHDKGRSAVRLGENLIPVSSGIGVHATTGVSSVRISWRPRHAGNASLFYGVLRSNRPDGGLLCAGTPNNAADDCQLLYLESAGTTRLTSFTDHPGRGRWTYRIGVAANWLNDPSLGDVYVVSKPATVTVR